MASYLLEIRTGGDIKQNLRNIINDTKSEFDLYNEGRTVPHITLFGPYKTNRGYKVKEITQEVLQNYQKLPYRINGYGCFRENNVIYFDVVPSNELRDFRRELARKLRKQTYGYPSYDSNHFHKFHITITKYSAGKTDAILQYLRNNYDVSYDTYANRITSLGSRSLLWEWDIPRGIELSKSTATSRTAWQKTNQAINEISKSNDHQNLLYYPTSILEKYTRYIQNKLPAIQHLY